MEIPALSIALTLFLLELNSALAPSYSEDDLKQRDAQSEAGTEDSRDCRMQGTGHLPAFSMDGDYIIGGVFAIHVNMYTAQHNYTTMPEPLRCTERLVGWKSM